MNELFDNHIHLQDKAFNDDRTESLNRARAAGVTHWAVNGTSPEDWPSVQKLIQQADGIIPCYGLHPWYVNTWKERDWQSDLHRFLGSGPAAVGEIGLDCWIKDHDITAQKAALRVQLQLAHELKRPAIIHCLRAWDLLLEELKRIAPLSGGFMIHGYGGSAEFVKPLIQLGAYLSFAGSVLDETRTRTHKALLAVPSDRLLIETDAPDMPPPSLYRCESQIQHREKYRNEPANLPLILEGIATLRHTEVTVLAAQLNTNAHCFWGDTL